MAVEPQARRPFFQEQLEQVGAMLSLHPARPLVGYQNVDLFVAAEVQNRLLIQIGHRVVTGFPLARVDAAHARNQIA